MTTRSDHRDVAADARGLERPVFFSDAVFAIVITLLILPLTEETAQPAQAQDVARETLVWPRFVSFATSFLVIGQFWLAHHRMFGLVQRYDRTLLWLNLVALLTVTFLPFPTALLGGHPLGRDDFPVVFYAASMTVASFALVCTWVYAMRAGLVDEALDAHQLREFTLRSYITTGIFLLSVGAAFAGLLPAVLFWVVLIPLGRILVIRHLQRRRTR